MLKLIWIFFILVSLDRGRDQIEAGERQLMADVRNLRHRLAQESRNKRPPPEYITSWVIHALFIIKQCAQLLTVIYLFHQILKLLSISAIKVMAHQETWGINSLCLVNDRATSAILTQHLSNIDLSSHAHWELTKRHRFLIKYPPHITETHGKFFD